LGRLDPNLYLSETNEDLYDVSIDHLGRVWFTVSYDETAEQLRITIHKARNLRSPRYQSFRSSSAIISNDMTSLGLLTPAPTQDCRISLLSWWSMGSLRSMRLSSLGKRMIHLSGTLSFFFFFLFFLLLLFVFVRQRASRRLEREERKIIVFPELFMAK
uniref:Cadherin domain-containing protein n=1 Tax=Hydatigena taeniaeformis TaxID=6205 RepID=A0A0R3WSQ9_HYDTA